MRERGRLVVLEGLDTIGRETVVPEVDKAMAKLQVPYGLISFPQYDKNPYADLIKDTLDEGKRIDPKFLTLAYGWDRFTKKDVILQEIMEDRTVIVRRYIPSSEAFGAAFYRNTQERREFLEYAEFEYKHNGMPEEDLVIYVETPAGAPLTSYQRKVEGIYRQLSKKPHWRIISGSLDDGSPKEPEVIAADIIGVLQNENIFRPVVAKDVYVGMSLQGEPGGWDDKEMIIDVVENLGHNPVTKHFLHLNPNRRFGDELPGTEPPKGRVYRTDVELLRSSGWIVLDLNQLSIGLGWEGGIATEMKLGITGLVRDTNYARLTKYVKDNDEANFNLYVYKDREDVERYLSKEIGKVTI